MERRMAHAQRFARDVRMPAGPRQRMISRAVWLVSHTTQSGARLRSNHDAAGVGHVNARVCARAQVLARALVRGELGYRLHE